MEEFLRNWVPLLLSVIALGTAGWNILTGPAAKLAILIEKLDARMDAAERLLAAQAVKLEQVPDNDALHEVQIAVERMNSDVRVVAETLRGVKETSNLMRDWLLEKGVK